MALRVLKGGVMTSSKNIQTCINILSLCIHQQKTRSPNAEFFFIASYMFSRVFRGFEWLSWLFWRWVMASCSQRWNSPQISVFGCKILTISWFLSYNFRSRYASKSVKGSNNSFSSQESKKHWAKKCRIGLGPSARQSWPKMAQTCSHCDVTHKEPKIQAEKIFYDLRSKTCRIRRFDQLSSSIGRQVMAGQSLSVKGSVRSVKG